MGFPLAYNITYRQLRLVDHLILLIGHTMSSRVGQEGKLIHSNFQNTACTNPYSYSAEFSAHR